MPISEVAGYRFLGRIGSGGMGDVYKAFHPALNRYAAVKVLHQVDMAERFRNEAYIQSSVNHPHIARLYNFSVVGDTPCIVMEYVEGESLDALLRRKGKLSNEETIGLVQQAAGALSYLHERDILHRDIKPQNFKVQEDGTLKMLDFGIAKAKYTPKFTRQGYVVGTTEYMAPEQFENKAELKSDVWSLGVMTYELITGYMPFEGGNPIALRAQISRGNFTDPKILVQQISDRLESVIEKSIRCNPSQRISARDMVRILEGRSGHPGPALKMPRLNLSSMPSLKMPAGAKTMRGKRRIGYALAFVLAFALITWVFSGSGKPAEPPAISGDSSSAGAIRLTIDVPGIRNAEIIFPDGNRHSLPFEMRGKEGEAKTFTLHAEGYADKNVVLDFSTRRSAYDYNLEKLKE